MNNNFLEDLTIIDLDNLSNIKRRIKAEKANISDNDWILFDVTVFKTQEGVFEENNFDKMKIYSIYNINKVNQLFKNFDTMSFVELIFESDKLFDGGYSKKFLSQSLHTYYLPFFVVNDRNSLYFSS